jgi:hypothetical protein
LPVALGFRNTSKYPFSLMVHNFIAFEEQCGYTSSKITVKKDDF